MKEKEALYSFSNDNYEKDSSNVVKQADKTDVVVIPIDQIHDFKNHPYRVEKDDEINRATVQTLCEVSSATSLNYLNRLIELNVIEKTNDSVATVYKIVI